MIEQSGARPNLENMPACNAPESRANAAQTTTRLKRLCEADRELTVMLSKPMCWADRRKFLNHASRWLELEAERSRSACLEEYDDLSDVFWRLEHTEFHPDCKEQIPHTHCESCGRLKSFDLDEWTFSTRYGLFVHASSSLFPDEKTRHPFFPDEKTPPSWRYRCLACEMIDDYTEEHLDTDDDECGSEGHVPCFKIAGNLDDPASLRWILCVCAFPDTLLYGFRNATIVDFDESVRTEIGPWLERVRAGNTSYPPENLFITGKVGAGKTHAAVALFKEACLTEHYRNAIFQPAGEMYMKVRSARQGSASEAEIFQPLADTPLLVLDDIHADAFTARERGFLLNIINHRANQGLLTITTSNRSLDQISQQMGDEIASRLVPMKKIVVPGDDRRVKEALARKERIRAEEI